MGIVSNTEVTVTCDQCGHFMVVKYEIESWTVVWGAVVKDVANRGWGWTEDRRTFCPRHADLPSPTPASASHATFTR